MPLDPVDSALDSYLHEQEEREASNVLEDVAEYVRALQGRVDRCDAVGKRLEERARQGGAGSKRFAADAKTARSNALAIYEVMLDLKRILEID